MRSIKVTDRFTVKQAVGFSLLTVAAGLGYEPPACAQAQIPAAESVETIVITGSRIRRTSSETSSPVEVISADQLQQSGLTSTQDVLHNLTANGQGLLSQKFSGAFATGASKFSRMEHRPYTDRTRSPVS